MKKKLAGWRVGLGEIRGGVRVSLASIEAYRQRRAIGAAADAADQLQGQARKGRRRGPNPAHEEAVAQLRAWGVKV